MHETQAHFSQKAAGALNATHGLVTCLVFSCRGPGLRLLRCRRLEPHHTPHHPFCRPNTTTQQPGRSSAMSAARWGVQKRARPLAPRHPSTPPINAMGAATIPPPSPRRLPLHLQKTLPSSSVYFHSRRTPVCCPAASHRALVPRRLAHAPYPPQRRPAPAPSSTADPPPPPLLLIDAAALPARLCFAAGRHHQRRP